jgi:hypothetical protein
MKRTLLILLTLGLLLLCITGAQADPIKYALSVFHFNIQYVAGGLEGLIPAPLPAWPTWELNAIGTEDMIVVESFEPIVDLFLEHPDWSVTLEMQGYFLDVLAERHPLILEKLRVLANDGGAELVSFHYSDQLFLAYPAIDWQKSVQLTIDTFEKYDLPLSGTVFCQEGQAGPGMAQAMSDFGYDTMVWPKNLWIYQHGEFDAAPYYEFGDGSLVVGGLGVNDPANGVFTTWTFLDDGEKLATSDFDPYFPWFFKHNPDSVQAYEDALQALAEDDFIIGSVTDYVADLQAAAIEKSALPSLMGGTWQPASTDGTHRWMGGKGLWGNQERDNFVRTAGAIAHRELLGAQTVTDTLELDEQERLDQAWRLLALGQVTDGTGINPFRGEAEYAIAHFGEVLRIATDVIDQAKSNVGMFNIRINTATGDVDEPERPPVFAPTAAPVELEINTIGRDVTKVWYSVSSDPAIYKLVLDFSAKNPGPLFNDINLRFIGADGPIQFSPALQDDQLLSYTREDFVFEHFYLPLANGLIGLGDNLFLIKDTAYCHLAAQIFTASPDVVFRDETAGWEESNRYVFYIVEGEEAALEFANLLNVTPTLIR